MAQPKSTALFTFALLLLTGTTALAATITSSQSGNWSASTTWGGGPAPTATDNVIINGGFTVTVDVSNGTCLAIQLGGALPGAGKGPLVFTSGSQLTVAGVVTVGASNNSGSITMTAGGTLICQGILQQSLGTWTPGTGTVELTASNTLPNNGITTFNNLTISGGTTTLAANNGITGDLTINPGATLDGGVHALTISGGWKNDGTFSGNSGTVIFNRNGNQTIIGSGANNFNLIRVNMGTSNLNTLEVLSTNFSAPDGFLTLSNGTFKVSGSFALTSTFILGPIYNIQPNAGLWINNPNVTVTPQAGGVSVRGILRVTAGTFNVGTGVDNSLDYVAGSSIIIEGGALNIAGRLSRNSPASTTSYNQSGGTVIVVTQGSTDITFAGFDLGVAGSSFTMSGGTIVIQNATSNATDYLNVAATTNVTGGTLQIGDTGTLNAQTIRIQSSSPIGNFTVSNATAQPAKPVAQLVTSSPNIFGSVAVQSGATLNANGLNIAVAGDWTDNGTFTGGPGVTFNGSGAQALTAAAGETFNGLTINKIGGTLTLNSPTTVNSGFALTQGTVAVGSTTLTLNGTVTSSGTLSSGSAGSVNYNQGSVGQSVLAGSYGNLIFSDFSKILLSSGTIGISGTFTPGSAVGHTVTGSTVAFNGGTQSIPVFPYNNLTLSGTGPKTGSGSMTVSGNFTNGAGIVFSGTSHLALNGTTHASSGTISTATLSVGSGGSLTNNGTVTAASSLTGTGTLTQGTTGILNIGGTADITTLIVSAAGNTVNYTGAGQTIRSAAYHHFTLSGSGSPVLTDVGTINGNFTLSGSVTVAAATGMTIGGNVVIGSGTSFDAGSFSHSVAGNWNNSGSFTAGTSTLTFNGVAAQTMSGSTFNNLVINDPAGVSMTSDGTVAGSLTLSAGAFSLGAHTLTLNGLLTLASGSLLGGASSNLLFGGSGGAVTLPGITLNNLTLNRTSGCALGGDVTINGALTITNGSLNTGSHAITLGSGGTLSEPAGQPVVGTITTTRNVTSVSGTSSFGNIGVDITMNGVAPGNTTVVRKTGTAATGNSHSSIQRYFDIAPATNSGLNAGLVFHYDSTEVNGQNTGAFDLYRSRDNGLTWNNLGGTVNTGLRTISLAGINDFSRWTASDTSNRLGTTATPTVVSLSPTSQIVGGSAFTLTVNGTDFVGGRSTIRFNGSDRTTTYVNTTRLTASIPATDLLVTGGFPITVAIAGASGPSNAIPFVVTPGAPASVRVETAQDGSGSIVPAQSLVAGSAVTVYAITRDALNNFVANVAADAWSVQNIAGGVVVGDLVPASDLKSAIFTGHAVGSATISATSGSLAAIPSGTITVPKTSGVNDASKPIVYDLMQNFPNPFNPSTEIRFDLPSAGQVSLIVYDIVGRKVAELASGYHVAGHYSVTWNASNEASGVYFYRLVASGTSIQGGEFVAIKKVMLLK